jgi:hypothetical protein
MSGGKSGANSCRAECPLLRMKQVNATTTARDSRDLSGSEVVRVYFDQLFQGSPVLSDPVNLLRIYLNQIRSGHLSRSHSHYKDFLDLRGDGQVVLYKRADHQNPKWTVRLKIPETDGFVVKSTKTTNTHEARRLAEDLYYQLEGRARRGEPINSSTFGRVFDAWSRLLTSQNQRAQKYVNGDVRRIELWALRYFRDDRIDQITENRLGDYIDWRLNQARRPAVGSLKNERTALRQLFAFAKRKGYINEIPELRIVP